MKYLLITFVLIYSISYCQNKDKSILYLNEDEKVIEFETFQRKRNSFIYWSKELKTDSIVYNKLYKQFNFGHLEKLEFEQIRDLISLRYNVSLRDSTTLVIRFQDTLWGYKESKFKRKRFPYKYFIDTLHIPYTKEYHLKRRQNYDATQAKCLNEINKSEFEHLFLYGDRKGYQYLNNSFKWKKIDLVLNKLFFSNQNGILIIRPDGQYYLETVLDAGPYYPKIVKTDDWEKPIKDYNKMMFKLSKKPIGFFKYRKRKREYNASIPTNVFSKDFDKEAFRDTLYQRKMKNIKFKCFGPFY